MLAAGEEEAVRKYKPESELRLSHLCRTSIRKHLLQMSNMNLFTRVPKLGLPKPLEKYLLFSELYDEDDDGFWSSDYDTSSADDTSSDDDTPSDDNDT